ncbi:CBS domain-containing protein [Ferdinandcohnia quinoae]|uniref:CBS domain-containing protein n=1 Tax=Fredinandcohnia quinoae TaxID=2918902 RepID=A0AAW5DZX1_9BACI|nr:CBS domain-containing protein [Fredinandcohnia sp. SECRCQ15]MCH1625898.1 CBS domain-containing protein [Fredinandcohnia sp. SECRCQ15]
MQAQDIMNNVVFKVKETDTVRLVVEKFLEHHISGVPVINNNDEIVAYISDGDIMRHIGKHDDIFIDSFFFINVVHGDDDKFEERVKKILDLNVLKVAKKTVVKVEWNEDIENIAATLGKRQIKKLPVERDGKLIGIISRGDVIRHVFHTFI